MRIDGIDEVPGGLKVTFQHLRWGEPIRVRGTARQISDLGGRVAPRGGETIAILEHVGSGGKWEGRARCSESDNYVKRVGRRLALGRALASMDLKNRRAMRAAYGSPTVDETADARGAGGAI